MPLSVYKIKTSNNHNEAYFEDARPFERRTRYQRSVQW